MAINALGSRNAQILRPIYDLYADQPQLLKELQQKYQLPGPDQINDGSERLATQQMVALLRDLAVQRGRQDLGLAIGATMSVGCFGSLSFLMLSSATFREMLEHLCQYYEIILHGERPPHWSQAGSEFFLELFPLAGAEDIARVRNDFMLSITYRGIQHAAPGMSQPSRVMIAGDGGDYKERYTQCFGNARLQFGAPTLKIFWPIDLLDKPLPSANSSLCKVFRKELDILLRALNADQTIIDQIQQSLARSENLAKVSLASIAAELAVGERTLARQLAEYDVSFRDLLANYKSTRAIRLLAQGRTVDQVSYYLGFSERAAFDRAFKKWQGITASRFQSDYQSAGAREVDLLDKDQLPVLPMAANQLLEIINSDSYEISDLVAVVQQDPSLTARLLALANSAMYGVMRIGTIKEAIVRIFGVDTLRNLALAMLANECFDTSRCKAFSLKKYWVHALATGQLAAELARVNEGADPSAAYLLGLLHNIGRLLLVQRRPAEIVEVLRQEQLEFASLADICQAEKAVLGVDTCASGAMLASCWNFPRYLSVSIRVLADADYCGEFRELVQIVALAEYAVRVLPLGGEKLEHAQQQIATLLAMDQDSVSEFFAQFRASFDQIEAAAERMA
jgi:HD-like signal output (HDOD) protein/AraC-like DNA-binding protein